MARDTEGMYTVHTIRKRHTNLRLCLSVYFDLEMSWTVHIIWKRRTNLRMCLSVSMFWLGNFQNCAHHLKEVYKSEVVSVCLSVCMFLLGNVQNYAQYSKKAYKFEDVSFCLYVLTWKCSELFTPFERGVKIWGCVCLSVSMFWLGNVQNCSHHSKEVYKSEVVSVCLPVCFDLEMSRTVHTIWKRCKNLRMCLSVCIFWLGNVQMKSCRHCSDFSVFSTFAKHLNIVTLCSLTPSPTQEHS